MDGSDSHFVFLMIFCPKKSPPPLKLTFSHLKMAGWNIISFSFLGPGQFSGASCQFQGGYSPLPNKKTVSSSGYTLRDNHIPQVSVVLVLFPRSPREIECNKKPPRVTEDGNWHNEMERKIFERKHKPEKNPQKRHFCVR